MNSKPNLSGAAPLTSGPRSSVLGPRSSSPLPPPAPPRRALLGLLTRRERWGLSARGWLLLICVSSALALLFLLGVHPFLAVTDRVADAEVLVVEGWISHRAIAAAVAEFRSRPYKQVYCTGGPVVGHGVYTNDFNTSASVGAERLKAYGLPDTVVQMVPSRVADRDRTFGAALALRNWFRERNLPIPKMNVLTEDVHARRSWLLLQRALGPDVPLGIISVPNPGYQPQRWWRYSEGVKEVVTEAVAYAYAWLWARGSEGGARPEVTGQTSEVRGQWGAAVASLYERPRMHVRTPRSESPISELTSDI